MPPFTPGTGLAYATPQTVIGLAREATRGTPATPTLWLPTQQPKYQPDQTMIEDKTLQGSMVDVYDLIPGLRLDTHAWSSYPYLDSFPALVQAELGSTDSKTAAPTGTTTAGTNSAGSTTLNVVGTGIPTGSWVVIGTVASGNIETHYVSTGGVTGLTLATPLIYTHTVGDTVTGLTKHQFSLLNNAGTGNQPASYTISDYDGEEWRQLVACQLDKLTIKGNATGLVTYDVTWFGNAAATPSPPSASFSTIEAVPGWTASVSLAGSLVNYVIDWEFNFARGVKPIPALTGQKGYYAYFAGPLVTSGKMTLVDTAGAPEIANYLAAAGGALDFTLFDIRSGNALEIHATNMKWQTGQVNRSKEWVEETMSFTTLPTAADALAGGVSPIMITCANGVTSAYA